jgi:uncharacterized protein
VPTLDDLLDVPPPPGRSRESSIRLDRHGRFHHDGDAFAHAGLSAAMHTWIARHPRNGRFILFNGYDWSYFAVEDAPYFVMHLETMADGSVWLHLSDGSKEQLGTEPCFQGDDQALYVQVKSLASKEQGSVQPGRAFLAKFTRHAQTSLGPYLRDDAGIMSISLGKSQVVIGPRPSFG